jgi:hypothetical protein
MFVLQNEYKMRSARREYPMKPLPTNQLYCGAVRLKPIQIRSEARLPLKVERMSAEGAGVAFQ